MVRSRNLTKRWVSSNLIPRGFLFTARVRCPFCPRCTNHNWRILRSMTFLTFHENRCEKTTWGSLVVFVGCTLVAQIVLTIRSEISLLISGSELVSKMLRQDVCRNNEECSHHGWLCVHNCRSVGAWGDHDNPCSKDGR